MRIIFTNLEAVFSTSEVEGEFLRYDMMMTIMISMMLMMMTRIRL